MGNGLAPKISPILGGSHVEGDNFVLEARWAEGSPERLPDLAAELVRLKVDVTYADGDVLVV